MKIFGLNTHNKNAYWVLGLPVISLFLLLGGCKEEQESAPVPEVPRNVRVLELSPSQLTEYFEISGPMAPVRGAVLSSQESGPVVDLAAAKGQEVAKGEIIVEQDRTILQADMQSASANLDAQSYNVDKVRKLNKAGKVSRMELLNAESLYEQAKSIAAISQERFQRAAIRAPFDGVIVERYVELGQLLMPGQPVVRIIDPSRLKLEAYLTDQEVAWVKVGTTALVNMGQNRGTALGTVTWVGLEADRMTGKFKMELEIPNPDGHLRSGVIGRAKIAKNVLDGVLSIPRDAVMYSRAGTSVFVIEGDRAYQRLIKLGADQGALVTVDSGLIRGEKLVVRGHRSLRDSSLVTITEQSTRNDGMMPEDSAELLQESATTEGEG